MGLLRCLEVGWWSLQVFSNTHIQVYVPFWQFWSLRFSGFRCFVGILNGWIAVAVVGMSFLISKRRETSLLHFAEILASSIIGGRRLVKLLPSFLFLCPYTLGTALSLSLPPPLLTSQILCLWFWVFRKSYNSLIFETVKNPGFIRRWWFQLNPDGLAMVMPWIQILPMWYSISLFLSLSFSHSVFRWKPLHYCLIAEKTDQMEETNNASKKEQKK